MLVCVCVCVRKTYTQEQLRIIMMKCVQVNGIKIDDIAFRLCSVEECVQPMLEIDTITLRKGATN